MIDPERERERLRRRTLGWSLACDEIAPGVDLGRDLRLVADGEGRLDLARTDGIDNLGQSLAIALTTPLGSDVFNLEFGFDGLNALADETLPVLQRERVRVGVINVLRRDPRVRQIVDVKLEDDRLDAPAAGSRTLEVRVVFETVAGEQAAVDLGGVTGG